MTEEDEEIIHSLERSVTEGDTTVEISIYRSPNSDWILEVVDEYGNSTVYDDLFPTDQDALDEALSEIESHGIDVYVGEPSSASRPMDDMPEMQDTMAPMHLPLSDDEIKALDEFLLYDVTNDEGMTLDMLDGYMHALAVGPETVMPSVWLPQVWGQTKGMVPTVNSLEQANWVMQLVMRQFNSIVAGLEAQEPEIVPIWAAHEFEGKTYDDGEGWAYGFTQGVAMTKAAWAPLLESEQGRQWYRSIGLLGEAEFSPDQDALTATPEQRHDLTQQMPDAVLEMYLHWLPLRQAIYEQEMARAMQPKVGRNEPCPCGSGKKFKKCCGAPVNLH
jgi:uncharacterized protein